MKKAFKILKPLLALMMFMQGVSLVATCAVPCNMNAGDKLNCVVDSIMNSERMHAQDFGGAIRPEAVACGHLELTAPVASVSAQKVDLKAPDFGFSISSVIASVPVSSIAPNSLNDNRAGPTRPGSSQALLAVPPQNAPPVLV